ncbi:MAG: O-antigen ligase family protein [Acholeplasmataceae bacterium]|nr:O-antigen ligase family protein [Acholeplasmataceae bacterium]
MLSGEYNFLVDNMWLTDILGVILLILPVFLIFYDKRWIFGFYIVSIVANLPLIFMMVFGFSYELILAIAIIIIIIKDLIKNKNLLLLSTKESRAVVICLLGLMALNIITSFFQPDRSEILLRIFIYGVNLFILLVFSYYLIGRDRLKVFKRGFLIGALILVISMVIELIYGYYILERRRLRPGGLLLDPNVAAFALNMSLMLTFYKTKSTFTETTLLLIMRILIVFAVFLTVSRSGYLSTVLILSVMLVYYSKGKNRIYLWSTVSVLLLFYLIFNKVIMNFMDAMYQMIDIQRVFPRSASIGPTTDIGGGNLPWTLPQESRITLLKGGIRIFLANYIVGVGIGNVIQEMNLLVSMPLNTHNIFIQLLAESGIFMLGILLVFCYYLFHLIKKSERKQRVFQTLILLVVGFEGLFNHNLLNLNIIYLLLAFFLALNIIYSKEQLVISISKPRRTVKA